MKNPKFFLTTLFAAAALSATAHAAGEIISINFGKAENAITEGMTGTAGLATYDNGGVQTAVGAAGWANVNGNAQQTVDLKNYDGTLIAGASVTARSDFPTWGPSVADGTVIRSLQGSYYDLANWGLGSWNVEIESTFLVCDVYVYLSGDGGQYGAVSVNGTFYKGNATNGSVEGSGAWGSRIYSEDLVLGTNALKVSGVSGAFSLTNERSTANRATLSGIQVVETYTGTAYTGTLSGDTNWGGISFDAVDGWTNSRSTVSTSGQITTTGGSYADLTLSVDATLTLEQDVVTDAFYLTGDGKTLTLIKGEGSLTFSGPAVVRVNSGATLEVNSADITFAENVKTLTLSGSGKIRFTDANAPTVVNSDSVKASASTQIAFVQAVDVGTGEYTVSKGIQIFEGGITAGTVSVSSGATFGVGKDATVSIGNNDTASVKTLNLGTGSLLVDGRLSFDVTSNTVIPNVISGSGTICVENSSASGAGIFLTSNSNNFFGKLIVGENAKVQVGPNTDGGRDARLSESVANIEVKSGGTFVTNLGGSGKTFAGNIVLHNGATIRNNDGHINLTGNIQFGDDASSVVSYTHWWNKNIELSGVLSGAGTVVLESSTAYWSGETAITISGNSNTFSGTYELKDVVGDWGWSNNPITLMLASENAAEDASINLTGGNQTSLKLATESATIAGLSGTSGSVVAITGTACVFTVNGGGDFAGNLASGGASLKLVKDGEGTLTLTGTGNNYSGGTEVKAGTLVAGNAKALGSGEIAISGGTLSLASGIPNFAYEISMTGGSFDTSYSDSVSVSSLTTSSGAILSLGMLSETDASLTATGTMSLEAGTVFDLSPALGGTEMKTYVLVGASVLDIDASALDRDNLLFGGLVASERVGATFALDGNVLKLNLVKPIFTDLTWIGGDGATWKYQGDTLWSSQIATETGATPKFENGDTTIFNTETSVAVEGAVQPGGMVVNENVTFTGVADSGASLALATGTALSVADGKTATIDASLGTTGLLKKTGAGTLELSGAATSLFSTVQITEGCVNLLSVESLKSVIATEVSEGATLGFSVGANQSVALPTGMISGAGTLEKLGEGSLTVSGGTNAFGTLKISGGTTTFSGGVTTTTNGTIVENAELVLATGGQSSALRGTLTINDGGLVKFTGGDATGWGGGATSIHALTINSGGKLHINDSANQTFAGMVLTLNGGEISGETAGDTFDLFAAADGTTSTLTALGGTSADDIVTSTISAGFNLRQNDSVITVNEFGVLEATGVVGNGDKGTKNLIKSGAGTLMLSGNNIYSGGTSVSEGKLIAASATALGMGGVEIGLDATLKVTAESGTVANVISGDGEILVNTAGTITLSGANTFEGPVNVSSGTLVAGSESALGAGAVSVASGATLGRGDVAAAMGSLTLANGATLAFGSVFTGTAFVVTETADLDAGVKFDFSADFSSGRYELIGAGAFADVDALSANNLLFGGKKSSRASALFSVENNKLILDLSKKVYTDLVWQDRADAKWENCGTTLWQSEQAGGSTTFENGDSVIFSTANAEVVIVGDIIAKDITATESAGLSTGTSETSALTILGKVTVGDGATLALDKTIVTSGALTKEGAGTFVVSAEASEIFNSINITEGTFGISLDAGTATFAGTLSGAGTFEKLGAGTLELSRAQSYSGGTLVSGGTLKITNQNALGSGVITIGSGATLELAENMNTKAYAYVLDGGMLSTSVETSSWHAQVASGEKTLVLTADSAVGGTANFGMISSSYAANELDLGGNTLTKSGSNTFFLANTTITSGKIQIEAGKITFIDDSKQIKIDGDVSFVVSGDGLLDFAGVGMTLNAGTSATIEGAFNNPATITVNAGATLDLTRASRKEAGSGSGALAINGGTVKIANMALGAGSNFGASFDSTRISLKEDGILDVTAAQASGSDSAGLTVNVGTYRYSGTGTSYINAGGGAINVSNTLTFNVVDKDAVLSVAKTISAIGTVKITGAGTVLLSGANEYTGGTTLESGTLAVGSAAAFGKGTLTLAGGTLIKADGSETLTLANNVSVAAAANIKNLNFAGTEDAEGNVSGGVWSFTDAIDTSFAGVALTDVSFSKTTIDVSGVDFDDDNLTMTLFTNYAGTAEDFIVAGGTGAGTISVDASKNVIFTAGENFLSLVWDPNATEAGNDKVWSTSMFNGKEYSANPNFRKFKFLATTTAEAGTVSGEVTTSRLNVSGDYAFSGVADDAGMAAKVVFASSRDDAGTLSGMAEVSVAKDVALLLDETVATSGSITKKGEGKFVVAADAVSVIDTVQIMEGTFGLSVAEGASAEYAGTVYDYGDGTFEKLGAGTLVLAGTKKWFEGTLLVSEGTLKLGTSSALGASSVSVVVGKNGTLDLNGQTNGGDYGNYVLAGGALINTGAEIGDGSKQLTGGISLTADSSVGGTSNFGMISNDWGANKLDLAEKVLTKTDSNTFFLANTTITSGEIHINAGSIKFVKNPIKIDGDVSFIISGDGLLDFAGVEMTLNAGTSATIEGAFNNPATITVNAGATLDLTLASRKEDNQGSGRLVINGGTVKIAETGWGVGSNWGANFNTAYLSLSNGGIFEVTAPQEKAKEAPGMTVSEGTYRYSGTRTSYINAGGGAINVSKTLTFDIVNADANLTVAKLIEGSGSVKLDSAGAMAFSGENTYSGGTTITRGTLKVGNDKALGAGTVTVGKDGTLETGILESTTIANVLAGTGAINIKGNTILSGENSFNGKYSVSNSATLELVGKLGADTAVAEIAAGSELKYAHTANATASGVIKLEKDATLLNASADDVVTGLAGTISGNGNIRQLAGTLSLNSADLREFAGTFVLENGTLSGLSLDSATASVDASVSGGTMKNWTVDNAAATVAVLATDSVALEGAITLTAGTLNLESVLDKPYFTGTASVEIGDGFVFNFQNLALQDTDDPNTKTAKVQVFDSGLTLSGWDKVGFEDIRISGKEIDAHYNVDIGNSGDVTITLTSQTIIWKAGSTGTWDNQKMNWQLGNGTEIAFADYDTVCFENDAEVELSGKLIPAEIIVADNKTLVLKGSGEVSGGTTTVASGASLKLTVAAEAVPAFKNKVSGSGTFVLDNAVNASFSSLLNGGNTLSGSVGFTKQGAGMFAADVSQNAYSGKVSVYSGKILVSATDALGTGTVTLNGGSLEVVAAKETTVVVNNVIAGSTGSNEALTLSGEGNVVLTQENTYTGATAVAGNAIARNAKAFGESAVEISGRVTLDSANADFGNDFSGNGRLLVEKSASLSGDVSKLAGTLVLASEVTLKANSASNFAGALELGASATFEKVGSDKFTVSGTIESASDSAITVSGGTLSVGGANAQSFAGTLSVGEGTSFEKIGANTLTLSGALAGTGTLSVSGGTLSVGSVNAQNFGGAVSLASGTTLEKTGANTLTLSGKLSGNGSTVVSAGTLELNTAEDYALDSVISGEGTLKKSSAGKVTLAAGTNVADIDLAGGMLKDVKIGNNGVSNLKVSAAGTTLEALTTDGGILDVSEQSVILSGNVNLSGGTIVLGKKDSAPLIVAGTTTITGATIFNLRDFVATDYPTHTNPNTLGETASVVYQVFDVTTNTGATLNGWENLDKGNFTIGSGAALSDRAHISLDKANGSLTLTNEIYSLTWKGDSGTWTVGNGESWTNDNANKASDTVYMNSDRVTFAGDAAVALGSNVAPTSLSVKSGADLTIEASDSYKITGTGTVSVGENASLTFNSAHDYTGTTTLANGATVRLNLAAGDAAQFTSNLVLASGATGTLLVDTTKLGAAGLSDLDKTFTGTFGEGAWSFEKLGEGSLAVSSKMSAFTVEDSVNIAAGTLKLMAVDAIGFAKTTVADGATLEVAVAKDAALALAFSGNGNFRKSGGGTLTLANSNAMFGGNAVVAEGTLLLADAGALGDSRKSTSLEVLRNAQADLAFGGSFGKELKGEGRVNYVAADRLVLTADSKEFVGTFALTADNAVATARQATSFGNGNIAFGGKNGALAFVLTPASGQTVADVFAGSFSGEGTISVETGLGIAMTLSGSSADFEGAFELKAGSKLIAEKGDALGNEKASVVLGKDAELFVGSAENSSLAAVISGDGSLTKLGAGTVDVSNKNDFTGTVTVKDGLLRATSLAALGKSSQVLLDSAGATLELKTSAGKTETFNKVIRGSGNLSLGGGGVLNWENAEKRFAGVLKVSEKTTLNTSEFFKVESGSVVLDNGAVWNANGGLSVKGNSTVALFAAEAVSATYGIRSRASQTLAAGTQLSVGGFVASANKSGSVVFNNIVIMPTNGGNGASVSFEVTSEKDAETPRITLTNDASVSLNNVAIEVVLDESISSAWDVPEIEFVYRDGTAADVSGEVESVTVVMANGTEVKYVYDSRAGSLSLSPVSPDMNLAYAAMVAMPTELFNQDAQSLHRRMEQRRFETASNKDEWQFFAQAQSMSVENGSDRADSAVFDFSTYGALVGGDVRLSESTVFGMALAYDRGTATIHDSQGEIDADSYRATIYAGTVFNDYYFAEGGAHFGFSSYEIERQGDYGNNKGDVDGWSAGLFATAGGLIPTAIESFYLTPYVGVSYLHSAVEKIEETGTRSMTTDDFSADSLRSRVGIGASYAFAIGETPTRFGLDVAYSHEFLDDEVDADVVATGVAYSRTITEKALPEDVVSVGASFDFSLSENTGLFLNYTADFGMNSDISHRGNVGFRFTY